MSESSSPKPEANAGNDDVLNQRAKGGTVAGLLDEVKALPFATLFPVKAWLKDKPWDLVWVRWFMFFAFYPLVMLRLFEQGISLTGAAWAFGIYFAAIWALIFHFCMRPPKIDTGVLLGVAGFTAVIGINVVLGVQKLPVIRDLYYATDSFDRFKQLLGFILGVGIVEECAKALPLWWRFVHKKVPATPRECAFLGCASGLAFGVAEAVSYSILYAWGQYTGRLGYGDYLTAQFLRLISLPLLHALWTGTVGYFVGLGIALPARRTALLIVGIGAAAVVHGCYDTFSDSWIGTLLGVMSLLAFVGYSRSADEIAQKLRA